MTQLAATSTLAEIVGASPGAARLFEGLGLDYCCGGRQTLAAACEAADLAPGTVLEQLGELAPVPDPDWAAMGPAELVDHLEATHHAYLHAELPRLSALAEKVATVHGGRHPELHGIRSTYEEIRSDLEPHLAKEERILFPMIRTLAASGDEPPTFHCGSLRNPISVMLGEHDRVGELLARLRHLTQGHQAPADGCASYRALYDGFAELEHDTHLHVHKENNVLFPAVVLLEAERAASSPVS